MLHPHGITPGCLIRLRIHTTDNVYTVAERLRRRSREQKIPSSIPRLDISDEVAS